MSKYTNHSNDKYIVGTIFVVLMVACGLAIWLVGTNNSPVSSVTTSPSTASSTLATTTDGLQATSTISQPTATSPLDKFALCLSQKKATFYGAVWCAHCQNQKKLFGDSFKYVTYVECPTNAETCLAKGVERYPTWIFADGTKLEGEKSLKALGELTGCPAPI